MNRPIFDWGPARYIRVPLPGGRKATCVYTPDLWFLEGHGTPAAERFANESETLLGDGQPAIGVAQLLCRLLYVWDLDDGAGPVALAVNTVAKLPLEQLVTLSRAVLRDTRLFEGEYREMITQRDSARV